VSKKRKKKKRTTVSARGAKSQIQSVFISHSDLDHQAAFDIAAEIGNGDSGVDFMYVDDSGVHTVQLKATAPTRMPRKVWTGLPEKPHRDFTLPPAAESMLLLMSRARRNDVLNDIMDWYPGWVAEKGRFRANLACWWRIGMAVLRGLLDLLLRIGEIVGKFRGAK
jgi:hypothetical protein